MVNMIETRKREHSRKPDEQYPFIEAASPGPFLEMFARYAQPGWTVWGDEASDDTDVRGRTHRGYAGGAIEWQTEVPSVFPHARLSPDAAEALGKTLRVRYEAGASVRQLCSETGYSITRVRHLLAIAGTALRGPGRPKAGTDE
jgi:hypothetical protein